MVIYSSESLDYSAIAQKVLFYSRRRVLRADLERLLMPQRSHWVDMRGAPGGYIAGHQRDCR